MQIKILEEIKQMIQFCDAVQEDEEFPLAMRVSAQTLTVALMGFAVEIMKAAVNGGNKDAVSMAETDNNH